jgi:hypothetical protein
MKMDPPFLILLIRPIHLICLIYQLNVSRETFG